MNFPPNDAREAAQHTLLWLWILSGHFTMLSRSKIHFCSILFSFFFWMDLIIARLSYVPSALVLSLVLYEY